MSFIKLVASYATKLNFHQGLFNNSSLGITSTALKALGGFVQIRELGRTTRKRRTTHAPRHWVKRRIKRDYEGLTQENKEFLQATIEEKAVKALEFSPLKEAPWERGVWTPESKRCGVIARKIGIYPLWLNNGKRILATLLQVVDNHVINYIPPELVTRPETKYKGKGFLVVGAESTDPQKFTAAYNGLFDKAGVITKKKLCRFSVTPNAKIQPGTPLYASHFRVGDYVNVYGKTIGHGFQGVVKRWGFAGGRKTHGVTKSHRRPGAIGAGAGRKDNVWKGKKMPGHMGQERRLLVGVKILRINTKYDVIWVRGPAVPGHVHAYCQIFDCYVDKKCHTDENPPHFPTYYPDENDPLPKDIWDSSLHNFSAPTVTFEEKESAVKK